VRVETIPLILGVLIALIGLGLLADAWLPQDMTGFRERRRSERTERHLGGEAAIGIGVLCMAAALIGRDTWNYGTVAVIAGSLLLLIGAWLNRRFLRERIVNRGALRRDKPGRTRSHEKDAPPPGRPRIR
jgi:small-conductance mechanosensitive channel